jgi:hypothetical protein
MRAAPPTAAYIFLHQDRRDSRDEARCHRRSRRQLAPPWLLSLLILEGRADEALEDAANPLYPSFYGQPKLLMAPQSTSELAGRPASPNGLLKLASGGLERATSDTSRVARSGTARLDPRREPLLLRN